MRRSIICFLIIASLILCSVSVAFANPLDPWTSVQADRVTNGVISIDNTLSNVYTALSALYNYLKNNGDGVVEGLLVLANRVSNIISTIDYYLPNINTNLQNIYSSLAAHSGSNLDLWGLTNSILTNTNALATGQLGIAQDVYNIAQYQNSIQSKLTTLNSTEISSLAKLTNIDSNVDQVESQLNSINTNLSILSSKYKWTDISNYSFSGLSNTNDNYQLVSVSGLDIYAKSTFNSFRIYNPTIFYIRFPVANINVNYVNSIDVILSSNNYLKLLYYDTGYFYTDFYFYSDIGSVSLSDIVIKFNFSNNSRIQILDQTYYSGFIKYIDSTKYGFYDFLDHLALMNIDNSSSELSEIKNILIDIDNNSDFIQNNNDLQINVDIDPSVGTGVTVVISKIQDLLDFGISLQEFLVVLDQFDNLQWFTRLETYEQVNQDPRFSPGYIDLYD